MFKKCKICNSDFYYTSHRFRKTCSKKCRHILQSTNKIGKTASEETKRKMSETRKKIGSGLWNKGRKASKETREKIRIASIGANNHFYGKKHGEQFFKKVSGSNHYKFKGRYPDGRGYILTYSHNHPACYSNHVFEHRLAVEKYLGRYLQHKETVHHINGIKDDNRIENLMAFTSKSAHRRFHCNPDNVCSDEIIFDGRNMG